VTTAVITTALIQRTSSKVTSSGWSVDSGLWSGPTLIIVGQRMMVGPDCSRGPGHATVGVRRYCK
jgi:hypothetical protein